MMENGNSSKKDRSSNKKNTLIAVSCLLLIALLLLVALAPRCGDGRGQRRTDTDADTVSVDSVAVDTASIDSALLADSLARARALADSLAAMALADSLARARTLSDSLAVRALADSLARARARMLADSLAAIALADSLARELADSLSRALADSLAKALADSLARALADSLARADSLSRIVDPCARDTTALWVYADPSGGLHRGPVSVRFLPNKKSKIEWSLDGREWNIYDDSRPIAISSDATLHYRAEDDCGRRMDARVKRYVFDLVDRTGRCPQDMEYVSVGNREFCIDAYKWPNRRDVMPTAFVSLFQAMDSCFSVRKRLCTSDEWTMACAGPEGLRYPYGNVYDGNACVTRDTIALRSGRMPECRSHFGVFDMSGNLAEWTSTPAPQDRSFYNVMGGFWASGAQSRCADARYSYFPQNRHNPVGFRCCRDAAPSQEIPARRRR
ncbi:MAG: SUMF1/EgtB/PvdO family nonheme iron enzyme [Chitinispirillales bacterium]|jgi:hypothetical protein|nr:SUMF1/EgtB/PvdO family nonheme iron enzyme [Chitinispirillales bacterium]